MPTTTANKKTIRSLSNWTTFDYDMYFDSLKNNNNLNIFNIDADDADDEINKTVTKKHYLITDKFGGIF